MSDQEPLILPKSKEPTIELQVQHRSMIGNIPAQTQEYKRLINEINKVYCEPDYEKNLPGEGNKTFLFTFIHYITYLHIVDALKLLSVSDRDLNLEAPCTTIIS